MRKKPLVFLIVSVLVLMSCARTSAEPALPPTQPEKPARTPTLASPTQLPGLPEKPRATKAPAQEALETRLEGAGLSAMAHLQALSGEIGARPPGTPAEREAEAYITGELEEMGYAVQHQAFDLVNDDDEVLQSANLMALKSGSSEQQIIVGAHYDSGDESKGADDNASGVAVLLELAERLAQAETAYTLVFIAFGSEENDLDGSYAYVEAMREEEIGNTTGMVNLDSLLVGNYNYLYSDWESAEKLVFQSAAANEFDLVILPAEMLDYDGIPCECADYDAFQVAGIPFAFFESTDWSAGEEDGMTQVDEDLGENGVIRHTEFDNLEYIAQTFPGRMEEHMQLYVTLLYELLTQIE